MTLWDVIERLFVGSCIETRERALVGVCVTETMCCVLPDVLLQTTRFVLRHAVETSCCLLEDMCDAD